VVPLLVMAALQVDSALLESQTFDEAVHLTAGYRYWLTGRFSMNREHPPLQKLLSALPLLLLRPELPDSAKQVTKTANAVSVHLLDTQARGHISRRVLHQQANGELTQDSVWWWSSAPNRYLDTALRLEVASRPDVRLVDGERAPDLAATLLVWDLESQDGPRFVGVVEFQIRGVDGVLDTHVVRASEPVSTELPGDLAAVTGRLLRRFAAEGLTFVASEQHRTK